MNLNIKLFPTFSDDPGAMVAQWSGQVLTVNGKEFDLGKIPKGMRIPYDAVDSSLFCEHLESTVDGYSISMRLYIPWDASDKLCFPADITMTGPGRVPLPEEEENGPV
ncbi:hypothetical protein [Pseudomonas protegens]|uniref:hypothetical protein n=1 Tax=Pseudomonas protegens TaxID=380021 RepID=UPI00069D1EBB|nr:hypothetical protein [Pseudomonas protegens]